MDGKKLKIDLLLAHGHEADLQDCCPDIEGPTMLAGQRYYPRFSLGDYSFELDS